MTPDEAIEKALLYTFQLSNKDYRTMQRAMSELAFINALRFNGYDVLPIGSGPVLDWAMEYLDVNNQPCRFDHHGGCQEHGYLEPSDEDRAEWAREGACPEGIAVRAAATLQLEAARG